MIRRRCATARRANDEWVGRWHWDQVLLGFISLDFCGFIGFFAKPRPGTIYDSQFAIYALYLETGRLALREERPLLAFLASCPASGEGHGGGKGLLGYRWGAHFQKFYFFGRINSE